VDADDDRHVRAGHRELEGCSDQRLADDRPPAGSVTALAYML
jgi:hypothetical protein